MRRRRCPCCSRSSSVGDPSTFFLGRRLPAEVSLFSPFFSCCLCFSFFLSFLSWLYFSKEAPPSFSLSLSLFRHRLSLSVCPSVRRACFFSFLLVQHTPHTKEEAKDGAVGRERERRKKIGKGFLKAKIRRNCSDLFLSFLFSSS